MTKFLPFDPVHKRTEGIFEKEDTVYTKGAPQVIIEQSDDKEFDKQEVYKQVDLFASKGFRTLGVAYRKQSEDIYHFVGLIPLYDPPRVDSKEAIDEAKAKGIEIKMLTGDNIAVAKYISTILGIGDKIEDVRTLKGESIQEYIYLSKIVSKAITQSIHPNASKEAVDNIVKDIMQKVENSFIICLSQKEVSRGTNQKS